MGETALYAPFEVALASERLRVIPIRLNPGKFCGIGAFVKWSKNIPLRRQDFTIIEGAPTGAADFMVLLEGGLTLFVEFKSPTGRQREAQAHFETACRMIGHPYVIARSVEEAVEAVRRQITRSALPPPVPAS